MKLARRQVMRDASGFVKAFTRRLRFGLVAAALAVVAGACGNKDAPQDVLSPEGPIAKQLDDLWNPVFAIAAVIFVIVQTLVIVSAIRFRAKGEDESPPQIHGNARLELTWTIIPALILLVVGVFTVATLIDINRRPAAAADVLDVRVTGKQWWWEYEYPKLGVITANELHIPINTKVDVSLTSSDVVHSFWAPKLAGKVDAIPGRINHLTIEATKPGEMYVGQCAEFCGISHANMRLRVYTHTQESFDRWVADQTRAATIPTAGREANGAALFRTRGCAGCHAVDGYAEGRVGPSLTHFASRDTFAGALFDRNDANLRRWLRDPPAEKPMMPEDGLGMPNLNLSEDEITDLIAFLNTLR